jgi:cation transport ATPase
MFGIVKRYGKWLEHLLVILLSTGGIILEYLTAHGRQFTTQELHERWIVMAVIIAAVVISLYTLFVYAFWSRLRIWQMMVLLVFVICIHAFCTGFYILFDPATEGLFAHQMLWEVVLLAMALSTFLGFIGLLGYWVRISQK